ncbi:CheA signal transduction histidine kinase [Oleispira antarctica RB-8]|uniref:Chemotaxis protein CheA n=1 Tax=Oleispira antarctica RB-8 TaxID=698738 RepID=R4YL48_OLEAN|nr:CheA signal transduction histidine kinase [Oleispira antarctica RB-8]
MSIDLSQFHQVFFEESFEGLDIMESSLLALDLADVDAETINTIFRAAHSIKGGAGTFGFMQISGFTHVLETLLDEIRGGAREIEQEHVDIFLQCVDCLRGLMSDLQAGSEPEMTQANELKSKFEIILAGEAVCVDSEAATGSAIENQSFDSDPASGSDSRKKGWKIEFIPCEDVLCTGNEPYRMFRELKDLAEAEAGSLDVIPHLEALPEFSGMHPEMCYLSWTVFVRADVELADIEEIFEWVVDDCEIRYERLSDTEVVEASVAVESKVENSAVEESIAVEETVEETIEKTVAIAEAPSPKAANKTVENTSIRVSIDKIDGLINMVGELVITQSMLGQLGQEFDMSRIQRLQEGLSQLEQNTRELQESVMKIRMLPISFAFSRFPRLVHDLSKQLEKEVELVMIGENTELDKTVMEKIGDPLVHLVRNSLDHGLECPQQRLENGKSSIGTITLNAYHHGGSIVIEVKDDGAGLNKDRIRNKAIEKGLIAEDEHLTDGQIYDLIFQPGFSTADVVSDVSGRGVGMDVVRRNIAELNGSIDVSSTPGEGSVFSIRLPLTLAILDGQLVKVGEEIYIFPLVSIVESIQLEKSMLNNITGNQFVMQLRNDFVPIVCLQDIFNIKAEKKDLEGAMLVVVEGDNGKVGIVVDELLGQQQVVIKSLEKNYQKVDSISGATILGDGTVALIVDISGLNNKSPDKKSDNQTQAA